MSPWLVQAKKSFFLLPRVERWLVYFSLCCLAIGFFLRVAWIDSIPFSYYHDEMDHVFLGEAVARYGTDISGDWQPTSLTPAKTINVVAELTPVFHAAIQRMFGYGPQSGHLPNMLFGFASIILIGVIATQLSRSGVIGMLAAGLLAINPWHVYVSRLAYEAPIALFFLLGVVASMLAVINDNPRQFSKNTTFMMSLFSLSAIGAFFTYHGAKITVFCLLALAIVLFITQLKNRTVKLVTITSVVVLGFALGWHSYQVQLSGQFGQRQHELILDNQYLTEQVNLLRQRGLAYPGSTLFINKVTVAVLEMGKRLAFVFDIERLVFQGAEYRFQFSLFVAGYFGLSFLICVIVGFAQWHKREKWLVVCLLLIGAVTSVITISYQAEFRSGLAYALLSIIAAVGCYHLVLRWYKNRVMILVGLVLIGGETVFFATQYFSRYAVVAADNHYLVDKLLARYVRSLDEGMVIVHETPYRYARSIVAYNQSMPLLSTEQKQLLGQADLQHYYLNQLEVTSDCSKLLRTDIPLVVSAEVLRQCNVPDVATRSAHLIPQPDDQVTQLSISSPIDSRAYFYILNDTVCSDLPMAGFIYNSSVSDYQVEQMSDAEFCQHWVKKE